MTRVKSKLLQITLATIAGTGCLFVSENLSLQNLRSFVTEADAIIGRPLTPMSYAGVARRTTYRAATYGAGAAYAYHPPVVVGPACYQAVNPYGQIYTVCP